MCMSLRSPFILSDQPLAARGDSGQQIKRQQQIHVMQGGQWQTKTSGNL